MASQLSRIDHMVVLMLENRSFDHMLAHVPGVNGATTANTNFWIPGNAASGAVPVSFDAAPEKQLRKDPGHDLDHVRYQLHGTSEAAFTTPSANSGFLAQYLKRLDGDVEKPKDRAKAANIMKCFSAENLPVLSRLASEYAVCDAWFSSVPGPTWPNRFFAHAATSRGSTGNRLAPSDVRTIYHHLTDAGVSWKIFFHDLPQALGLRSLWPEEYRRHVRGIKRFYEAAQAGTLPAYSFIEPRYFSFIPWADRFGAPANDQHPPHDVNEGEELIAAIYQVLRASPQWERTLLVVTYDEHGGCYDHQSVIAVPPPEPPPAGAEFDFATTGVRVPAVVVSPWIDQGKVDSTPYDHATIPATLKERFGLANYLTARDAAANTLGGLLTLTVARADAIVDVAPPRRQRVDALIRREMVIPSAEAVREAREESMLAEEPLSDFQETLVELARTLEVEGEGARLRVLVQARRVRTEEEGAEFVQERARRFLNLPDDE